MSSPPMFAPPYPPPPGGGGGGRSNSAFSPAVVAIISVLGSAFLVVSYYRIFSKLCTRWQNRRDALDMEAQLNGTEMDGDASAVPHRGLDEALIKKITVFSYKADDAFTVETDCPVCLMEFRDHQELRMLPKCAHAFHVPCIDTWLTTHSNCPLCRAAIYPPEVLSQYPFSPRTSLYSTGPAPDPENPDRLDYDPAAAAAFRFTSGARSSAPTLRGLLYEDQQQHGFWISADSARRDPGDESLRLYDPRDHGGDSSSRHHNSAAMAAMAASASGTGPPGESQRFGSSTTELGSSRLTPTSSFKELHRQHSRSRDRDHKWRIPARRPSFRRNPFSIVRSYSMGTSRRLVPAIEFLDLEDMRCNSQRKRAAAAEKLFGGLPHEYGITEAPDFASSGAGLTLFPAEFLAGERQKSSTASGAAGPSTKDPTGLGDLDLAEAALKGSAPGKGRSVSFRSPFGVKRTLSSGRNRFSFRHTGRSARVFTSDAPATSGL